MAVSIDDSLCTVCGSCKEVCPNEALDDKTGKMVVAADNCMDCGLCVPECPAEAIKEA